MSWPLLLALLPVVPLLVALWVALSRRAARHGPGRVVAAVALAPIAAALLVPSGRVELPELLVPDSAALALDGGARAALLLFGSLWLAAGLTTERQPAGRGFTIAALVTLCAATTLALAEGGPLIYTALAATGYGLYATVAAARSPGWGRAGRAWVVLLVVSDLLIFEALLAGAAHPGAAEGPVTLLPALVALALRAGVAPAHLWLPAVLVSAPAPVALLLVAVPASALFVAGPRLLPDGAAGYTGFVIILALAGVAWCLAVSVSRARAGAAPGHALAAMASVLLLPLATGTGASGPVPWLMLVALATTAAFLALTAYRASQKRPKDGTSPVERREPLQWVESAAARVLGPAREFCMEVLPRLPRAARDTLRGAWDGEAWSRRLQRAEAALRSWPVTWVLLLLFAVVAAWLLAR